MDKAYQAKKTKKSTIPNRCWKKREAVRRKSYIPIMPEEVKVTTGEQESTLEEMDNLSSTHHDIAWNFKRGNYIRQLEGATHEDLHDLYYEKDKTIPQQGLSWAAIKIRLRRNPTFKKIILVTH